MTAENRFIFIGDKRILNLPQEQVWGSGSNCVVKDKCERGKRLEVCKYRSV